MTRTDSIEFSAKSIQELKEMADSANKRGDVITAKWAMTKHDKIVELVKQVAKEVLTPRREKVESKK